MVSGTRIIEKGSSVETQPERGEVQFEDDTNADTCDVGKGCYIEHYLDRYCIVKPFLDSYEEKEVPIINALYCYDDQDGQSYNICINQALYFKDEEVALMLTFQDFNLTSPDGTWYPSFSNFEVSKPDLFN